MRRRVQVVGVRQTSRIGFRARSARRRGSVTEAVRGIRGVFRESLQASPPAVQPSVHEMSSIACRHDLYVRSGAGGVYSQRTTRSVQITATENVPLEQAAAADEGQRNTVPILVRRQLQCSYIAETAIRAFVRP
eukprot:3287406-Pleurochrysis_carterae.AAC.1